MEKYLKGAPQQVSLQLPKLKKVGEDNSQQPKIKLPKLTKVTDGVKV